MDARPKPHAYDIFLSHSGKQKGFVIDLERKLSSIGYSVFFDLNEVSLPPGQRFPDRIFAATETCKLGIVVLSDDFFTSRWPMAELCALAERLAPLDASVHDRPNSFTVVPLFYELSPEDIKRRKGTEESKFDRWVKAWEEFERKDGHRGHITVAKCEEAVAKLLPLINGIVRRSRREQGEASYIEVVATKIQGILPCRSMARLTDRSKPYSGEVRLCGIILEEFRKLEETEHPSPGNAYAYVLGMYGVPGSGKSTLCQFLCDHDAIFDEFGENVIYLWLPTNLHPQDVAADSECLSKQYSKLLTRHKNVAYRDLIEVRNQLRHARISHKMFLVLDNISLPNKESYSTMLQDILSSGFVLPGSKIMLVAQSAAILEEFMTFELAPYSAYKRAIIEVPCMSEEDAMEIIRNRSYPSVADGAMVQTFVKRRIPSSLYIPLYLEHIGVLLRERLRNNLCGNGNARESNPEAAMKLLLEIASEDAEDAVQKLVAKNFEQMPEDLQVLFCDIALFILPVGYWGIDQAALILNRMRTRGTMDDDKNLQRMKTKIYELRKYCALSIAEEMIGIHDIYMEHARNKCVNSTTYVNATWSNIILDAAAPSSSAGPTRVDLKCLEARTINIGGGSMDGVAADRDINLNLEIGAKAKAVTVTYNSHQSAKCNLVLSGNMSSLVCLEMQNVQLVAISPSTVGGADFSNLFKLELINRNKEDTSGIPSSRGQKRKRTSSFLELINHSISQQTRMGTRLLTLVPRLVQAVMWPLASYNDRPISLESLRRMSGLRKLILWNSGIRRFEDIGRYCPQLEDLEIHDERQQLMSVSIGSSTPKLRNLFIEGEHLQVDQRVANIDRPGKSSIVLQLGECKDLEEVSVDVRSFDRVQVEGPPSSESLSFCIITDRNRAVMSMPLISNSSLSQLGELIITCDKEETLNVTQHPLPLLESLVICDCNRLARLAIHPSYLQNLQSLSVFRCKKLEAFEGLECLVKEQLLEMSLESLPHLQCKLGFEGVELEKISVRGCPGVKISYDVLASSEGMEMIDLEGTCLVTVQQKESAILDADNLHDDQGYLASNRISIDESDDDATMGAGLGETTDEDTESDMEIGISPYQDTASSSTAQKTESGDASDVSGSAEKCSNTQIEMPASQQFPTTVAASLMSQHCLRICNGQFTSLEQLLLDGCQQEHMREIEGLQHLLELRHIRLCNLPGLTRISGTWPPSVKDIEIRNCPKLQEAPRVERTHVLRNICFRNCAKLKAVEFQGCIPEHSIEFVGCESMETFPVQDAIEELGTKKGIELSVLGSKFASVELMRQWLRQSQRESCLWTAALAGLMWEYLSKNSEQQIK